MPLTMKPDELWTAVDAQRQRTIDLLAGLPDAEWARPSLCSDWTVKDVAAHLAWQGALARGRAIPLTVAAVVRRRGDIIAATGDVANDYAARRTTEQLLAEHRALVGLHRPPPGGPTAHELLIDVLVHHHDMALALGQPVQMDPVVAAEAAERTWSQPKRFTLPVTKRLARYRWRATDIDWDRGDGPLIEGPMGAILLALVGRETAFAYLSGEAKGEAQFSVLANALKEGPDGRPFPI